MRGVRPMSPIQTTSVSSSKPRLARSSSSVATPWSVGGSRVLRSREKLFPCVSQSRLPAEWTVTRGTPASDERGGQQAARAEGGWAIGVAEPLRLVGEVERVAAGRRREQFQGPPRETVQVAHAGRDFERGGSAGQSLLQPATTAQ